MINLEEEARKRRERLKIFKSTNVEQQSSAVNEHVTTEEIQTSFIAENRAQGLGDVDSYSLPAGQVLLDDFGAEILALDSKVPDTLEAQAKALLAKTNESSISNFIDSNAELHVDVLAPKNRNSDLKREYSRRMASLEKQTRRSIVDIVRARLETEAGEKEEE